MVELRKRKAPAPPPVSDKRSKPAKSAPNPKPAATDQTPASPAPNVDDTVDLDTFGGEIETNDGTKTTLKQLVADSESGVVLFTYPKASTPGCMSFFFLPAVVSLLGFL